MIIMVLAPDLAAEAQRQIVINRYAAKRIGHRSESGVRGETWTRV